MEREELIKKSFEKVKKAIRKAKKSIQEMEDLIEMDDDEFMHHYYVGTYYVEDKGMVKVDGVGTLYGKGFENQVGQLVKVYSRLGKYYIDMDGEYIEIEKVSASNNYMEETQENNIDISNDIVNILREHGITLDCDFTPPLRSERLEHIFALVREMLRTY